MKNTQTVQSAVKRHIVFVGIYIGEKFAAYFRKVHGATTKIELVNAQTDDISFEGLKKLIMSTDKQVYIAKGLVPEPIVAELRRIGLNFTQINKTTNGVVVGHWYNTSVDHQSYTVVSTDEEIEALIAGKVLTSTAG